MTMPSGTSWMAMPVASACAPMWSDPPNPTPMASPSGRLCSAIAVTNSQARRVVSRRGPSRPFTKCSCGTSRSISIRPAAPSSSPAPTMPPACHGPAPCPLAAASAGMMSENEQAASITPAPKPSIESLARCENCCDSSTGTVPSAVASAAMLPPSSAPCTRGSPMKGACSSRSSAAARPPSTTAQPSQRRKRAAHGAGRTRAASAFRAVAVGEEVGGMR